MVWEAHPCWRDMCGISSLVVAVPTLPYPTLPLLLVHHV